MGAVARRAPGPPVRSISRQNLVGVSIALQETEIDSADASCVPTMLHAGGKFQDSVERTIVRCAEGHMFRTVSMTFFIDDSAEKVAEVISQIKNLMDDKDNTF
ncbi:hypothetical protein ACF08O_32070 [Streptomyces paradoxus]|uniref:hypothetical protein n=1 Tax=Streptomyces paradoxus TaxID=66375 RepID=UPI0037017BAA